jgi:hypothetical protein
MIKSHVVRAGDHLGKIAHEAGLDPDKIWNHPKNKDLRAKRPDQNILLEGDVVFLPLEDHPELPLSVGADNAFAAVLPEAETHLRFGDAKGPYANESYRVEGLDEPLDGTTDADGKLVVVAPVTARSAKVVFEKRNKRFTVLLGEMDPIDQISGVQARLIALGLLRGAPTNKLDDATVQSVRAFQGAQSLEVTGKLDDVTKKALQSAFGC